MGQIRHISVRRIGNWSKLHNGRDKSWKIPIIAISRMKSISLNTERKSNLCFRCNSSVTKIPWETFFRQYSSSVNYWFLFLVQLSFSSKINISLLIIITSFLCYRSVIPKSLSSDMLFQNLEFHDLRLVHCVLNQVNYTWFVPITNNTIKFRLE